MYFGVPVVQPVDFTTLTAACSELRNNWLPARLEQVYQRDRHTIALGLRTLDGRSWVDLCWHPQAARICVGDPPPRTPDTFTFSEQLRHQLNGLALVAIEAIASWERVVDFQFARRPGDPLQWHLYVEVMGKYSNVILTTPNRQIVTVAHQVSEQQSSLRPLLTGEPYEFPPRMTGPFPSLEEPFQQWRDCLALVPGSLWRNLLKTYRGLSSNLAITMTQAAGLNPDQSTDTLAEADWRSLFQCWQEWLQVLKNEKFVPGWLAQGYTVMGWQMVEPVETVQTLLNRYYTDQLNQQEFKQLRHQISQKVDNWLKKLHQKAEDFATRLHQSDRADDYKDRADLLMAYLHEWQPGMQVIQLPDFASGKPVTIPLDPEKNAVQNAQALYKRHQKLKRSRHALEPLLAEVRTELVYLEQIEVAIAQLNQYQSPEDLRSLEEVRDELIQQGYLSDPDHRYRGATPETTEFLKYKTPSGYEVLVGRNNRQNDHLTFRLAGDYDLWFHTQEIPGSHVLLRLPPGAMPDDPDLQFTANLAAYHSRARQSDQAPVVYTDPNHVYKPKGAKPGIAIYKQERVLWGYPAQVDQVSSEF
jgi:predicted ribosome quality control (RQC) complex YloA/Tae2 family protein